MKKTFTLFLLSISIYIFAQAPAGYYTNADGKSGSALRTALQTIITNGHSVTSYAGLWTAYATTDENSSGKIWDMYSNCSFTYQTTQCGTYSSECDCYNREHTSPQSWFNSASPMYSDLFNVYPTDGKVNGMRSNYPYGEVGSATYTSGNGCKLGTSGFDGYTGIVFEPIDEYKGDFARTYFYMATRYADICQTWTGEATAVYGSNLGFTAYATNLFLKWSREDPVSAKEIARNNAVYTIQNNRNPFIDFPGLEEHIWGNLATVPFSENGTATSYLTAPSTGSTLDFGQVPFQQTASSVLYIKGVNLTGDLTIELSGTYASDFTINSATVSKANAEAGYNLGVNFLSQNIGDQTATLTISGGGITTTTVTLKANSTDAFIALPASGIYGSGFTANWTSSANATGYTLNVFSINGNGASESQTLLEEDFPSGLPSGWTSLGYIDASTASCIKMGSGSQIGKITTPSVNMTLPVRLLVRARQYGTDNGAVLTASLNSDVITSWATAVDNQDFTVDIPAQAGSATISLSVAAGSGNRVYVDYVKIATQGSTQTPVNVSGYPKSVGNVLSYNVSGLISDSTYFYTVTPEGNTTPVSSRIQVHTNTGTGVINTELKPIIWCTIPEGILLKNVPENASVILLDMMGKQIQTLQPVTTEISIPLYHKGLYLLQIKQNNQTQSYKILY